MFSDVVILTGKLKFMLFNDKNNQNKLLIILTVKNRNNLYFKIKTKKWFAYLIQLKHESGLKNKLIIMCY